MLKDDLKILLIQIRQNSKVKQEEIESFAKFGGIKPSQIEAFDVFTNEKISKNLLNGFDGVFIGGASEASVLDKQEYPFVDNIIEAIHYCLDLNLPVFASCFGFQAAILALGGEIIRDENDFEMGTLPIALTNEAEKDEIFRSISNPFMAVSVHQEKAINLPINCIELAMTSSCKHAFKVKDKPFWAFQFHPELDDITLKERLNIYKEKYTEDRAHFEDIISQIKPTPESNALVNNFIDFIVSKF